jgi:hypothetical protein
MSQPTALAIIIDWDNQKIIAHEFHTGPGAYLDACKAIIATKDDFPGCLKTVYVNEEAQPYAALEGLKALGMAEGQSDEEILAMLKETEK